MNTKRNRAIYGKVNTGTQSNGYKAARNKSILQNTTKKNNLYIEEQ